MSLSAPSPRKYKPEPIESSTTTSLKGGRRFAPQLVENYSTSSKPTHKTTENEVDNVKRPRKFAVEPTENLHTTSKEHGQHSGTSKACVNGSKHVGVARRFAPQPVETSRTTSKQRLKQSKLCDSGTETNDKSQKSSRKFAVQLIETASRSRRAGDTGPGVPHSDRTEIISKGGSEPTRARRTPPRRRSSGDSLDDSCEDSRSLSQQIAEARRLGLPVPKRQDSNLSIPSHSFRIPGLEPIDSSESDRSDESDAQSETTNNSTDSSPSCADPTRRRESLDGSAYFMRLAARQAERQMRDAALAAFPNDDRHRPVNHYVDKEEEDNYMSDAWSIAESDTAHGRPIKVNWEMREMQKHAEEKAATKLKERASKEAWLAVQKRNSASSPWGNAAAALYTARAGGNTAEERNIIDSLKTMRNSARPPMLGKDIEFPRCPSPEPARFDVTQSCEIQKRLMCSQSGMAESVSSRNRDIDTNGMWTMKKVDSCTKLKSALWGQTSRSPSPDKGLWAGSCIGGTGLTPPRGPTGLMTPMVQDEESLGLPIPPTLSPHQLPPSPPPSNSGSERATNSLEEKLRLEQDIDAEFADSFVTQVYNYLSLGYPSMARKFDHELAKISHVDVSELRQDDVIAGARGYIRFGEENGLDIDGAGEEVKEHHCARWRALRMYVREWARQQPSWRVEQGGWGTSARRGSWAW